jgi:hypothetical protein
MIDNYAVTRLNAFLIKNLTYIASILKQGIGACKIGDSSKTVKKSV